jgi:polyvinyl alcohol dehydrogenase (cytochrome)
VQLFGPSGAGVWSSPTVDRRRGLLYVTTGNSHSDPTATTSDGFVAFDLRTGALAWSKQMLANDGYTLACDLPEPYNVNCPSTKGPDFDFASSAMLVDLGRGHRALIAGQKSGVVHAIDPDAKGEILWQSPIGKGGRVGGVQWGSATDGRNVYVALSDVEIGPAPPGTPGAQAALGASFIFNPKVGGGLFALDPRTGATRWHTPHPGCGDKPGCSPGQSGAVTAIAGVVFSGGLDGHLRAYASEDGRVVWDIDTAQNYETVNAVPAHGGALNGPGAVIVNGMLYVNSGYTHIATAPGNVLLAFSIDGR